MTVLRRAVAITVLALFACAPTASATIPAPPSQWYGLPGLNAASGAQWVRALAYSAPPNVVYAGLEGGGVFKSDTGGATWSAFNDGFPNSLTTNVRALLTSSTGTTVYAGTDSGIFKSTGGAWAPLAQGPEDDPANPKKLNQSVQALISLTGSNVMLAGVFSGGVYKSSDGGETWSPPPANSGMPASETIYGLTENIPGLVYATGGSGVYVSANQGSTWTRMSDGIPSSASPITTWAYPQQPQILFTSTGSNGIYRSLNGGLTWAPINTGLGAVRARGFQIFTAAQGAHLYAATEEGLWEALQANSLAPTQPNWHHVTEEGLIEVNPPAQNVIMWALTTPVIPGSGGLGLIAGTQSNGGYFLSFEPPDSPCPTNHTTNTTTDCPRLVDTTPEVGKALTIQNGFVTQRGAWTGTPIIEYAYQWQRCTSSVGSCSDIADAEEVSYIPPPGSDGDYFRIGVTATNPAPTFGVVKRYSAISAVTAASPSTRPGYNQTDSPGIVVLSPGETTAPNVGDTMYAANGSLTVADPTYGWFNPAATTVSYRWLRCNGSGTDCNEIPGATSRSYTLQAADGTHDLRVRVTGTGSGYSTELVSPASYDVTSLPAAIADPIPNPDGGDPLSQAPSLSGNAWVGETLAGSVGGWKDPTTDFMRRWVRCDADGTACTYIQQVASTDPETGPTYVVRPDDLGYTLRMRVTADVNNDLTPDGIDNHLPHAVEVDTPPSAIVTNKPVPAGPPPPGGGDGGGADTSPPVISALSLSKKTFVAGKGTIFRLTISEPASVRIAISKKTTGRRVGKKCRPKTRKNRHRRKCSYQKTLLTIRRTTLPAGAVAIPFNGKIGKRKLRPGRYLATIVVTDAAGNVSRAKVTFKIVRR